MPTFPSQNVVSITATNIKKRVRVIGDFIDYLKGRLDEIVGQNKICKEFPENRSNEFLIFGYSVYTLFDKKILVYTIKNGTKN